MKFSYSIIKKLQSMSAIASIPLMGYYIYLMIKLMMLGFMGGAMDVLHSNRWIVMASVAVFILHGLIGMFVIVDDYSSTKCLNCTFKVILVSLALIVLVLNLQYAITT